MKAEASDRHGNAAMEKRRKMDTGSSPLPSVPVATYRLQLNGNFGFAAARRILPYLRDLGISHVYSSPYFKARQGSMHGYDITDHNTLNPELGTVEEYEALMAEIGRLGMGHILDIVPNHMCVQSSDNAWWMDVLENGPSSPYASFFDIDWQPVKRELKNRVLIPVLGDQYGAVLENGEMCLTFEEGAFFLYYYEHRFPIIPKTYVSILSLRLDELEALLGADDLHYQEFLSIMTALDHLPPSTETDPDRVAERYREKEVAKRRLFALYNESREVEAFINANVLSFNGVKGEAGSFDLLDILLRQQVYRLSHWRVATEEINYRRFFDINSLGAIRMEYPGVFEETHRMVFHLIRKGYVSGLRVDHIDGLYDPLDYLSRLQYGCFLNRCPQRKENVTEDAGGGDNGEADLRGKYLGILDLDPCYKAFYIIGEKILMKGEKLPEEWPIFSTTGYWFLNVLSGLFVDTVNAGSFDALYAQFTQNRGKYPDIVYEKKKLAMQVSMSGEINALGNYLGSISEINRHTRDFTLNSLIKALVEVIAFFPIYRTYTNGYRVSERDCQYIDHAVSRARRKNPSTNASIFEFIRDVLRLRFPATLADEHRGKWLDFVMKFQQITGPIMAKGVEDTAFYVYNRLVCLNEVGGAPERFGAAMETFHGQNIERLKSRPLAMLSSSTHDTKRSEDVRARISVLSEVPLEWKERVLRWSSLNRKIKTIVNGRRVPDRNEEYLLYQTLVGAWPIEGRGGCGFGNFRERIRDYMLKAARESKVNTSWINPDPAYEEGLLRFIDTIMDDARPNPFLDDFESFLPLIMSCGMFNSLSLTLLKITSPGIPDFYQGTELWDLSLVDPDNRRPVDYGLRERILDSIRGAKSTEAPLELAHGLVAAKSSGAVKLYLISRALEFRRKRRELFETGSYLPLEASGEKAENLCIFQRSLDGATAIVVAPRFFTRLIGDAGGLPYGKEAWRDTRIIIPFETPGVRYRNILTGEVAGSAPCEGATALLAADVLASFPVALLEKVSY